MVCFRLIVILLFPVFVAKIYFSICFTRIINLLSFLQGYELIVENILSTSNSSIGDINVTSFKSTHGESLFNVQFKYYEDFAVAVSTFIFAVPLDERDNNFQRELLRSTPNFCIIKHGVMRNFSLKCFWRILKSRRTTEWNVLSKREIHYSIT